MGITAGTSVSVISRPTATSSTVRVQDGALLTESDRLVSTVGLLGQKQNTRVEMWDQDSVVFFFLIKQPKRLSSMFRRQEIFSLLKFFYEKTNKPKKKKTNKKKTNYNKRGKTTERTKKKKKIKNPEKFR